MRPDLTVTIGSAAAVVSGIRAGEAVDAIGATRTATWIGYEIPLDDLPRLRDVLALEAGRWSSTTRRGRVRHDRRFFNDHGPARPASRHIHTQVILND